MRHIKLGEVCDIIVGRTPPRADPSTWGGDAPWVSIADMNQGLSITSTKERISTAGAAKGRLIPAGTVLLSFKLSIGKVARAGMPLYTNEAIAALPVRDPGKVDAAYLLRALQAQDLTGGSNRAAMGSTLNKAALQAITVPLPPLGEQRRIAAILDQADAIRTKRRQVLAQLSGLKSSRFSEVARQQGGEYTPLGDLLDFLTSGSRGWAKHYRLFDL
ncbi:restriction endonuclease subunit S [Mobilicoccus sp.]|uniref:restriction endonuclease subunit S n=1 Tax=Mobilicoccus sp. TaxID=2034349 RepID=UPI0028AEB225|nr:restriction endonuclease subunit S [Mobilicoccus sp.]